MDCDCITIEVQCKSLHLSALLTQCSPPSQTIHLFLQDTCCLFIIFDCPFGGRFFQMSKAIAFITSSAMMACFAPWPSQSATSNVTSKSTASFLQLRVLCSSCTHTLEGQSYRTFFILSAKHLNSSSTSPVRSCTARRNSNIIVYIIRKHRLTLTRFETCKTL